jgi:DNA-binding NtrC family response regulator
MAASGSCGQQTLTGIAVYVTVGWRAGQGEPLCRCRARRPRSGGRGNEAWTLLGSTEAMPQPGVVAVINTSPDVVDMLRITLEHAGIVVVSAFTWEIRDGEVDVDRFIRQHGPRVVVYDIAPPYEANWLLFEHIRAMPVMEQVQFIVTTTNARQVEQFAKGIGKRIYEIVGKPFDLGEIVTAVREALRARPTR